MIKDCLKAEMNRVRDDSWRLGGSWAPARSASGVTEPLQPLFSTVSLNFVSFEPESGPM